MCAVTVSVLVVVVVVVVIVSAVIVLCVSFVAVVCPLWCAHVNVLLLNATILWLLSIDHWKSRHVQFLIFSNNHAKLKNP